MTSAFVADGDRWRFDGQLTFDDATPVLAAAASLPLPASGVVDLSGVTHADSAALAVLLALRRRASGERRHLTFASVPPMLDSLARVYGIEAILAVQMGPHARRTARALPPEGVQFALGTALRAEGTPTLAKLPRSLPPEGVQFALGTAPRTHLGAYGRP